MIRLLIDDQCMTEYDDAIPVTGMSFFCVVVDHSFTIETEVLKLHRLQRMQEFGVYYIMLPEYKGLSESFDKQVLCTFVVIT